MTTPDDTPAPDPADGGPLASVGGRPLGESAKRRAALLVAAGKTDREVAAEVGASPRTVRRWRTEPAFRARVVALRSAAVDAALGRLADSTTFAADVLRESMAGADADLRFRAAVKCIELCVKLRETVDFGHRLAALEASAKAADTNVSTGDPTSPAGTAPGGHGGGEDAGDAAGGPGVSDDTGGADA